MNKGFESYIKDYSCNFLELSNYAKEKDIVDKYYSSANEKYGKFFKERNDLDIEKFAIRHYRAKKEMYNSAQMLIEAKKNKNMECIIGYFFLCYYALFHAMQSLLFLNSDLDNDRVLDLSHNDVKKFFKNYYCKGNKSIMPAEIIDLFMLLKEYRELYSYSMPFNNPSDVTFQIEKLEYYIRLCFQLVSLNSFIIYNVKKDYITHNINTNIKKYFERCCYKKDPISKKLIKDDADKNFWREFNLYGMDFFPYALGIEHDMDEYGGYDYYLLEQLGFKEYDSIRGKAFNFVYDAIT
jgi:hypothetical protein